MTEPFPTQKHSRLMQIVQPGDVLTTAGKMRARDWLDPKDAFEKKTAYKGIRWYNKKIGYVYWEETHVRLVVTPDLLFEFTTPRATYTPMTEMRGKRTIICRPQFPIDQQKMVAQCDKMDGTLYDYLELPAFLLREYGKVGQVLADLLDREKRWVCSSGAGKILHMASGQKWLDDWETYSPAKYPEPNMDVPFKSMLVDKAIV